MAEVRKNTNKYDYNVKKVKSTKKKNNTNNVKNQKVNKEESTKKKSLWVRFRIFVNGVKSEFNKVHWPSKRDLVKYSIATFVFVICLSIFFYVIDVVFAWIQALLK